MKVVVTGGLGFLGMEVCKRLLRRGTAFSPVAKAARDITELTIFDSAPAELMPAEVAADSRVKLVGGAVSESGWVSKLVDTEDIAVFHFVSMMSGNSEADFDAAWDVNVLAQRQLLEALRELPTTPRFFFTSSTASLGADAAKQGANDLTKLVPEGTYGFTKSVRTPVRAAARSARAHARRTRRAHARAADRPARAAVRCARARRARRRCAS